MRFVLSLTLLAEYRLVLLRPTIRGRHSLNAGEVDALLEALATDAVIVDDADDAQAATDPGDDHLWRLLTASPRTGLITGDRLLCQRAPARWLIISPVDYRADCPPPFVATAAPITLCSSVDVSLIGDGR